MRRLLLRPDRGGGQAGTPSPRRGMVPPDLPLPYSWVLTNRLAVGPLPASALHWQQLQDAGLRSRFSCCYPEEVRGAVSPDPWPSDGVPLPDHRRQEPLQWERLVEALERSESLMQSHGPLYLHCMAGIERSPLIAVGLTARARNLPVLEALDWVRRCHPAALPLFEHLDLLERLLGR